MRKVLIVDDDRQCRGRFARLLLAPDLAPLEACDALSALRLTVASRPSALVLDWRLNDGVDAPGLMRELKRRRLDLPVVLMTSARSDERDEAAALRLGASFFFEKGEIFAAPEAFTRHVRALVLSSDAGAEEEVASYTRGGLSLFPRTGSVKVDGRSIALNPKELGLLTALLRRAGVVHPASTLWSAVWDAEPAGGWHHTLDNRVSALRKKLGPKWGARLVSRKGQGYLLSV